MFSSCDSLTDLDLSGFFTTSLEDIDYIFSSMLEANLTVDLRNADFSKVTNYSNLFYKSHNLNITIIVAVE